MVHGFHAGNGSEYVDRRVAQLLHELHVGPLAESRSRRSSDNAPRGAGIRPLLANVFLHHALDLWVRRCRRRHAAGRMRLAATPMTSCFQSRSDAPCEVRARTERGRNGPIEFGWKAAERHRRGSGRRPETFDFLGFMRSDPTGTVHGASEDSAPADDGEARGVAARHAAANIAGAERGSRYSCPHGDGVAPWFGVGSRGSSADFLPRSCLRGDAVPKSVRERRAWRKPHRAHASPTLLDTVICVRGGGGV